MPSEPDIAAVAKAIAESKTFYVEARVGSNNYRGECCRALWNDARQNQRADELIQSLATAYLALLAERDRLDSDLKEFTVEQANKLAMMRQERDRLREALQRIDQIQSVGPLTTNFPGGGSARETYCSMANRMRDCATAALSTGGQP